MTDVNLTDRPTRLRIARRDGTAHPAWLVLCALGLTILSIAAFGRSYSVSMVYTNDVFVFYDGIHRIASGLMPHTGFDTPLGALAYLVPYLGFLFTGTYAGAMEWASFFTLVPLLLVAVLLLERRVSPAVAALLLFAIVGAATVPVNTGEQGLLASNAMHYNRWGWAALIVLFLCVIPRTRTRTGWVEPLVLGLVLFGLFHLKLSYALVGVGGLGLLGLVTDARADLARRALLSGVLLIAAGLLLLPGQVAYVMALKEAVTASGAVRGGLLGELALNARDFGLAGLALLLAHIVRPFAMRELAVFAVLAFGVLGLIDQNAHRLYPVGLVVLFAVASSHLRGGGRPELSAAVLGLFAVFSLPAGLQAYDTARIYSAAPSPLLTVQSAEATLAGVYVGEAHIDRLTEIPADPLAALAAARLPKIKAEALSQREYLLTIDDGAALLRKHIAPGETLSTLDFLDPFSFVLDLPRRAGGASWWHFGRTVTATNAPNATVFFAQADLVMVPKAPVEPFTARFLSEAYGEALVESYTLRASSRFWDLYARRP